MRYKKDVNISIPKAAGKDQLEGTEEDGGKTLEVSQNDRI